MKHPKLRVYLMHAGWPYLQETLAIMYVYPHVYADLAVIDWIVPRAELHVYLRALIRAGLAELRDIFYDNAARFLRLDGAEP